MRLVLFFEREEVLVPVQMLKPAALRCAASRTAFNAEVCNGSVIFSTAASMVLQNRKCSVRDPSNYSYLEPRVPLPEVLLRRHLETCRQETIQKQKRSPGSNREKQ